jgi:proline iminopeptidase
VANLYAPIQPFAIHHWKVDSLHTIYVEQCGNPKGVPVLFLHGGPGGACQPYHRQFFDPDIYHIVLFDQRGCGRSTPHVELRNNTTQDLLNDIEAIREKLGVKQWILFGGSWGSTLALVYAQNYPQRVRAMILRGIFLARQQDIDWFYRSGTRHFYPEQWQDFIALLGNDAQDDPVQAYHELFSGNDEIKRMKAAKAWTLWESQTSTLELDHSLPRQKADTHAAMSLAMLECHYMINQCFINETPVLESCDRITDIPGIICHGRYDMICPVHQAYELHTAWPASSLKIIETSGHAATESKILSALVDATQQILK